MWMTWKVNVNVFFFDKSKGDRWIGDEQRDDLLLDAWIGDGLLLDDESLFVDIDQNDSLLNSIWK